MKIELAAEQVPSTALVNATTWQVVNDARTYLVTEYTTPRGNGRTVPKPGHATVFNVATSEVTKYVSLSRALLVILGA
jgi:hypothetical protein